MAISFKGYGENVLTFESTLQGAGVPVIIDEGSKAYISAADEDFIGFTTYADGEIAGVIVDGYVEAPYTGTAPKYGFAALVSDGNNGVKTSADSKHIVRVIKVDTGNMTVGFIL